VTGIDIHAHVVPATFPASVRADVTGWPSMEAHDSCHRNIIIDGKVYRTLSDKCWTISKRLEDMDRMGIALQVISPMPELFAYWMDHASARDLLRYVNDQILAFVAESNGKMLGLGAVPLQDLDLTLEELHRLKELGFAGVEIGSNINGEPLGSARFKAFFKAANELGLAIFVHAVRPAMERILGHKPLQQVLGYPTDVGLAAAALVSSNLMVQFPGLRIAFSHGGGTFASLLPRYAEGYRVFPAVSEALATSPEIQVRRFFYDTLVFDSLHYLAQLFGESQLIIGTDYLFAFHEKDPINRLRETFADERLRERLTCDNARRFLKISEANA
jgi:aminocarboxymuconate-semialdehyde decarboxylase